MFSLLANYCAAQLLSAQSRSSNASWGDKQTGGHKCNLSDVNIKTYNMAQESRSARDQEITSKQTIMVV